MRYRCLGASGLRVSVLGLGCSGLGTRLDAAESQSLVRTAVDSGVTLFDTDDVYGRGISEKTLGKALIGSRDEVVVATKVRWPTGPGTNQRGASRIHIRSAVEASLRRLGADRIDFYQIHAPDPNTPLAETVAVLDALVTSGKVLYSRLSNFAGWQVVDADWQARHDGRVRFVSTQGRTASSTRQWRRSCYPLSGTTGSGSSPAWCSPAATWPATWGVVKDRVPKCPRRHLRSSAR